MTMNIRIIDENGNPIPSDLPIYRRPQVLFIAVCAFLSGFFLALSWFVVKL